MTLGSRVVIIGNSGSGKSTLAQDLAHRIGAPTIDLDRIHWQDQVGNKREESLATEMVVEVAGKPRWIIEGVYGWLAAAALPFATSLIWLDLPWAACREGLARRGPWKGASAEEHASFLQWAEAYWQRQAPSSFAGHLTVFEGFAGPKLRLQSRSEVDALLATPSDGEKCSRRTDSIDSERGLPELSSGDARSRAPRQD
jgi:adenylate kinase family enzyme